MGDKQPEALSIAKRLKNQQQPLSLALREKAAAELRRLHEVNAELVEALSTLIGMAENFADELSHTHPVVKEAKAALAKAQGEPLQREWQTLTENEIKHLWYEACQTNLELTSQLIVHLARNIEAKLKEKNT